MVGVTRSADASHATIYTSSFHDIAMMAPNATSAINMPSGPNRGATAVPAMSSSPALRTLARQSRRARVCRRGRFAIFKLADVHLRPINQLGSSAVDRNRLSRTHRVAAPHHDAHCVPVAALPAQHVRSAGKDALNAQHFLEGVAITKRCFQSDDITNAQFRN